MTHGSLFSGIGGFDLAAEWMGWENVFHCEINSFGQKVLKYYWPKAISYENIKTTDFTIHRGRIDVLSGGFPCQPYSISGKRLGKEDDRHLWPEMLRAVLEIQPGWVVGENVRGLTNWNGGLVFDEVQSDLETAGYQVLPFLLPAAGVAAPHERYRIWFIAYANDFNGNLSGLHSGGLSQQQASRLFQNNVADTDSTERRKGRLHSYRSESATGHFGSLCTWDSGRAWEKFTTEYPICSGNDGLPQKLDGISFSNWRSESLKGYGNAVVPQVVVQFFKIIQQFQNGTAAI